MLYSPVEGSMSLTFFGILCVWGASLLRIFIYAIFKRDVAWSSLLMLIVFAAGALVLSVLLSMGYETQGTLFFIGFLLMIVVYVIATYHTFFTTWVAGKKERNKNWLLFLLFSLLLLVPKFVYSLLITFVGAEIVPIGLNEGDLYPVDNFHLRLLVIILFSIGLLLIVKKYHSSLFKFSGLTKRFQRINPFVIYFNYVVFWFASFVMCYFIVYLFLPEQWFYIYKQYNPVQWEINYGF